MPSRLRFTIKYGRQGPDGQIGKTMTHEICYDRAIAVHNADRWLAGNGWGGWPEGELRVWVVDEMGRVVHGEATTR